MKSFLRLKTAAAWLGPKSLVPLSLAAGMLTSVGPIAANASPITGSFGLTVWHVDTGGTNINDPREQALPSNPIATSGNQLYSGTFSGTIDLCEGSPGCSQSSNNILDFLTHNGGTLSGATTSLNTTMSTSGFGVTTLFAFTGSPELTGGTVLHDDGASLYSGGSNFLPSADAAPTQVETSNLTGPVPGGWTLWYVEANNLPAKLTMDVTVPEPASLAMLGVGLAGLGLVRRRRLA